jgi:hypothetical protein
VFAIAPKQQRALGYSGTTQLRFSGTLAAADLAKYPELSKIAAPGDRLTKLDLQFWSSSIKDDLVLEEDPNQADFRQVITQYVVVPCEGPGKEGSSIGKEGSTPGPRPDSGPPKPTEAGAAAQPSSSDGGGCALGGIVGAAPASLAVLGIALLALALARRRRR